MCITLHHNALYCILLHHICTIRACLHKQSSWTRGWSHTMAQLLLLQNKSKSVRLIKEKERIPLCSGWQVVWMGSLEKKYDSTVGSWGCIVGTVSWYRRILVSFMKHFIRSTGALYILVSSYLRILKIKSFRPLICSFVF